MAITEDDIIRVACRQEWDGREDVVNVFHYMAGEILGGATDAQLMVDIGKIVSKQFDEVKSYISGDCGTVDISFYNVTDDSPVGVTDWPGPYSGGTSGGETLPPQITAMLLLPTAVKRRMGRVYLPPMSEASQAGGRWVAGVQTAASAFMSTMLTAQEGDESGTFFRYIVWSRAQGEGSFPTYGRLAAIAATQRRRKSGRGS